MDKVPTKLKCFRLSDAELALFYECQKWVQEERGPDVQVTERMAFVAACRALQWRRHELERKRSK